MRPLPKGPCEPLSTVDRHSVQPGSRLCMWSLSGLAAWGGSMGVDPPAGRHCSVMSVAAAAAAARATGWIDILLVASLLLVLRYRKGFGRVGPDGKAKAKWLPCNMNSMCRQMQNEFDIILHLINYDHWPMIAEGIFPIEKAHAVSHPPCRRRLMRALSREPSSTVLKLPLRPSYSASSGAFSPPSLSESRG